MNTTEQSLALNIMDQSLEVFKNGAAILRNNKQQSQILIATGEDLLAGIEGADGVPGMGMDQATDNDCNDYIARCNKQRRELDEARKPITQMFTLVVSEFTGAENALDPTKTQTIPWRIQQHRNAYAKKQAEAKAAEQEKARKEAAKLKEMADMKAAAETDLLQYFSNYLLQAKLQLQQDFTATTLETIDAFKSERLDMPAAYMYTHFTAWKFSRPVFYHDQAEVDLMVTNISLGKFDVYATRYKTEMSAIQETLLAQCPMRVATLTQLANTPQHGADFLLDQAAIAEETIGKITQQHQQADQEQHTTIQAEAAAGRTDAAYVGAAHGAMQIAAPDTATGWEIEVVKPSGFAMIFQAWMENEGIAMEQEKLLKKTVAYMVKYVADLRIKTGYIIESPAIKYTPTYTAKTTRKKS